MAVLLLSRPTFGWQALSVPTGSMRPNVTSGSLVLVHRVPVSSLKVGDVITYTNPLTMRSTITHRIIKMYKINGVVPAFITKGDANDGPDVPVVAGLVQGKMLWHAPYLGYGLMWSKTWVGIAALVYLPALLIMIDEVRKLGAYYKKMLPYRLYELRRKEQEKRGGGLKPAYATAGTLAVVLAVVGLAFAPSALALLASNTVSLTQNRLSVAAVTPPACTGSTTNNTNVNINSTSTQTATTGNANNSGNTGGGAAQSGNASNSNTTNVTVVINNGC